MEDRYGKKAVDGTGVLYYLEDDHVTLVERDSDKIRAMIIARNHMASYLHHGTLPDLLKREHTCK